MVNHSVKSHRGRGPVVKTWCLCVVDSSFIPAKGYCCVLSDRRATTIIPLIKDVVRSGSIIHTDEFASYNTLENDENYEHHTVCHKYHFVAPDTGVHTQNVESYNNKLKWFIKEQRGVMEKDRPNLCLEFMFLIILEEDV